MSTSLRRAVRRAALEAWLSRADEVLTGSGPAPEPAGDPPPQEPARALGPPR